MPKRRLCSTSVAVGITAAILVGFPQRGDETAAFSADSNNPSPPRGGPVIDVHTHIGDTSIPFGSPNYDQATVSMPEPAALDAFVKSMDRYGIAKSLFLPLAAQGNAVAFEAQRRFPARVLVGVGLDFRRREPPEQFIQDNRKLLESAASRGARALKVHCSPRVKLGLTKMEPHDPRMCAIYAKAGELGLVVTIHVGDVDAFWEKGGIYEDHARHGEPHDVYPKLECLLAHHPNTVFIAPHFAGDPEHLERVGTLLDKFPNLHVDTSAMGWIVEQVSRKPAEVREFAVRYQDRILFGSDHAVRSGMSQEWFDKRNWTLQALWQQGRELRMPVPSPNNHNPEGRLIGADLPTPVLRKLYHFNAQRIFRLE